MSRSRGSRSSGERTAPLESFLAAAPLPQRAALRALLSLARRPRGLRLLRRLAPADHLALGLLAMARFEEPATSTALGWDPGAVTRRGRELRLERGVS